MTQTETKTSWFEANQAFLVAQFGRLKRRLAAQEDERCEISDEIVANLEPPPAIDQLSELLGLSTFERDVLLLCAGIEMDSELAALCGATQARPQRGCATFGLAMATLGDPHWSALTPSRPLRRFGLLEFEPGHGLASAPLRIDERVLHYLAGVNVLDRRLRSFARLSPFPEWISAEHEQAAAQALSVFESFLPEAPILHLCGDDPQGQEDVAALAAQKSGRHLFTMSAENLPALGPDLDQLIPLWEREALLLPAALLIQSGPAGLTASACHLAELVSGPLVLASRDPVRLRRSLVRLDVDKPAPAEQKRLWEKALGAAAASFNGSVDALSEQFRLSAKAIHSIATATWSNGECVHPSRLWNACKSLVRPRMEDLAERILPHSRWEDLILPELQVTTLRQLASQVCHRMKVYETWGFSRRGRRGLGVSALFAGESGTGKTMAAEVLACELALDLYRIDLSTVVSKYIGETEKNLKQVFDAAEEGGVLLLFDEADALFGKRGDVKDSHDRYANIEVSYLLQRMESYQGLAILTTNLKSAVDKAFQRRLRFTVNFPFPDASQREAIWGRIFPANTPTQHLDFRKLAQLNVTGGNIRNIALNAAFLAAESGTAVQMVHLLHAARFEAQKIERPLSEAEVRGWV